MAHESFLKFSKSKCKVLHLVQRNPRYKHRLEEVIEISSAAKDLDVLRDEKLGMTQECVLTAQKADHILSYIKRGVASTSREVALPLYPAPGGHHLEYYVQL